MSKLTEHDISMETKRTYVYPSGDTYIIENPKTLYISESGGHRVVDTTTAHIIRGEWVAIQIPKEGLSF